ncbi:TPA: transcriptional regulator, partial [Klebsiella pneumoniae]
SSLLLHTDSRGKHMKSIAEQIREMEQKKLSELIDYVGGQSQLARFLGVSKQAVNQWVSRGRISATAAIHVEALTGGAFRKEDLRPAVTKWIVK